MHNFVMRQGQNKVFTECINHAETHLVVMITPVDGIFTHVLQTVIHPAHIPFVMKTQATDIGWRSNSGERSRFFRRHNRTVGIRTDILINAFEQRDCLKVFASTKSVGHPLALLTRIIAVQHRRYCIDTQAIDSITLQPKHRITR